MKKFDFNLCAAGHPVATSGGSTVRILCTDRKHKSLPIIALVGQDESVINFSKEGVSSSGLYTLVMVPKPIKRYYNVFTTEIGDIVVSNMFKSTAEANANKKINEHLIFQRREMVEIKV